VEGCRGLGGLWATEAVAGPRPSECAIGMTPSPWTAILASGLAYGPLASSIAFRTIRNQPKDLSATLSHADPAAGRLHARGVGQVLVVVLGREGSR
jgi:hypothetical protein